MKILHVVGARPNFPKVAPIMAAMAAHGDRFTQVLVHTGQHYDHNMSKVFFEDLNIPDPDEYLGVGGGTHAEQTARIMLAFEPVLLKHRPDWVFVVGDVNSTVACALVAAKLGVRVAHVEAGLRSRDRSMPEEINRLLTDQLADLLFTPSRDADANLLQEGIAPEKIHFVGNVMIDTLVHMLPKARQRPGPAALGLQPGSYILATLHRPSNVDHPATLQQLMDALQQVGREWPVVFPVHPRTRKMIEEYQLHRPDCGVLLLDPYGYLDFLSLMLSAGLVLTDSGGIQEETTYLGIPCLTARPNTERPVTITEGTNRLVESRCEAIVEAVQQVMRSPRPAGKPPQFWDGQAAHRIVKVMTEGMV
ncbi:MAG: UDP-N-acetylglucosamine 2-epimerase (non-hydrolyzing) [Chloroflexi bacterium]|nr:UDP-N-acetylglucosamine 2-epimerase (non-hydrolyzing) [Chloroflexota bacterium]